MSQLILPGTANPTDVRASKTFSGGTNYGAQGTLVDNGNGSTITPGTTSKTIAAGIWDSANTVAGDANLISANIKSGVTIFGVTGTLASGTSYASGNATSASSLTSTFKNYSGTNFGAYALTVTGLSFTPMMVILVTASGNTGTAYEEYIVRSDTIFLPSSGNQLGVDLVSGSTNGSGGYQLDGTVAKMVSGGFTLPVLHSNTSYLWYAYAN